MDHDEHFPTDDAAEHLQDSQSHFQQATNDLKSAASARMDSLKGAASAKADEYRAAANSKAEELRGKAEAAWGDAKVRARTIQEDGEEYVRENPTRAVLMALGAGFMLSFLLRK